MLSKANQLHATTTETPWAYIRAQVRALGCTMDPILVYIRAQVLPSPEGMCRECTTGTPELIYRCYHPQGLDTISDDCWPGRRMDLTTAAFGARATHMSVLWAGWSSWRTRTGSILRYAD